MLTKSVQSVKSAFALFFASASLAIAGTATPAIAYAAHEHPFHHDERIKNMTQTEGNGYCRTLFQQLRATGDLGGGFDPASVVHIWAHIQNGDCVANTPNS